MSNEWYHIKKLLTVTFGMAKKIFLVISNVRLWDFDYEEIYYRYRYIS